MIFLDVYFAGWEDIFGESLLFDGHDKFVILLKVDFVGGIDKAIFCSTDA